MFHHRRHLRRWAARVLLLWLFGLGTGIANACLTTGHPAPVPVALAHAVDSIALHQDATAHEEPHHGSLAIRALDDGVLGHHGMVAQTNCQDFCSKTAVSIPQSKSALDDAQAHAVTATVVTAALPMPALAPAPSWMPRRDGVQALPIPIAFLRLAL